MLALNANEDLFYRPRLVWGRLHFASPRVYYLFIVYNMYHTFIINKDTSYTNLMFIIEGAFRFKKIIGTLQIHTSQESKLTYNSPSITFH